MKKLAIISTHPIQYYAPIFKLLHQRNNIQIKVFYTMGQTGGLKQDPGFGKAVSWDIPLLEGYDYKWADNTSAEPGSHHFKGIKTPGLTKEVEKWHPNAVLVFGWANKSHLTVMRYFKHKMPVYFRGDSTLLNEKPGVKALIKLFFLRWVYSHADHAFYVGGNNKAYFGRYGFKQNQLSFAPHAIDNDRFEAVRSSEAKELRSSLNIAEDEILILYAGKFEPVKNLKVLLAAFKTLPPSKIHLLLVGNGIDEQQLKEQAGDAGTIHFLDFKNQSYMPVLYQAADLFCLPSISETWGLSINEAMACGKAILASDKVGCAIDLVQPGQNGAIFKAGDVNNLADHLRKLTEDKELLSKFGQRSRLIINNWNFTNIAMAIENKLLNEA